MIEINYTAVIGKHSLSSTDYLANFTLQSIQRQSVPNQLF